MTFTPVPQLESFMSAKQGSLFRHIDSGTVYLVVTDPDGGLAWVNLTKGRTGTVDAERWSARKFERIELVEPIHYRVVP